MKELEGLPHAPQENSINFDAILDAKVDYIPINKNDLLLLKNIKKYIAYYKTEHRLTDNKTLIPIYFNNKIFNANMIKTTADILGTDLNGGITITNT